MTTNLTRREFLQTSAAAGGALMIGFVMPGCATTETQQNVPTAMPNSWVRVGSNNSITILCARSEMGQGVYTAMPTLIAEELDVDITKIKVEMAPAGEPYINVMIGGQLTGGSTSVRDAYELGQSVLALIEAAGGGGLTLQTTVDLLRAGRVAVLLGQPDVLPTVSFTVTQNQGFMVVGSVSHAHIGLM